MLVLAEINNQQVLVIR